MAITNHEKELIDYAADRLCDVLLRANPLPLDAPERVARPIASQVDASLMHNMNQLIANMAQMNQLNQEFQKTLAQQTAEEEKARHKITVRTSVLVAGPFSLAVALIIEAAKFALR